METNLDEIKASINIFYYDCLILYSWSNGLFIFNAISNTWDMICQIWANSWCALDTIP